MRSLESTSLINRRHQRRARGSKSQRRRFSRFGMGVFAVLSLLGALLVIAGGAAYSSLTHDLPSVELLPVLLNPQDGQLLQPTRIYDRSGEHLLYALENQGVPRRFLSAQPDAPSHFSPQLLQTTLTLLDPTFWNNPGFDWQHLSDPQAQTIAERLVSDLLLENEPVSLRRSLRMRILAGQITAQYGRAQILEWYLNSASFGHLAYGAESAAQLYLGKSAGELNLQESILLATVAQAPALNPLDAPGASVERLDAALNDLFSTGAISAEDYQAARSSPPMLQSAPPDGNPPARAFVNQVISELSARIGKQKLERGGLQIITSLDYNLQKQSQCALETQLQRLTGETTSSPDCEAARLLPSLAPGAAAYPTSLQGSSLILDLETGEVLAMVGDSTPQGEKESSIGHQPGSLLAPFIATAGFSRGWSPASLVWDIPDTLPAEDAALSNPDGTYHGPQRLRTALANDYLIPITNLMLQLGPETVWKISGPLGLSTLAEDNASEQILYQGGSLHLLELAQAYSTFANLGIQVGQQTSGQTIQPITVISAATLSGQKLIEQQAPQTRAVLSAQLAYLTHSILSDETARWDSLGYPNALEIGRPAGAKIGQTQSGKDVWTVGYTRQRLAITWMGLADESSTRLDPKAAAGLWHALIQYASRDLPVEDWEMPAGISVMNVCTPSGKLPTQDCPIVVSEVFLNGNEPIEVDDLYRTLQINRETGRLATVFTPPELIKEETFLVVPAEAEEWALTAGLPLPPRDYDTIQSPSMLPDVQITSPASFSYVRGSVDLLGSAEGERFASYRLQIGRGLNPLSWQQIGKASEIPVHNGLLASWNTTEVPDGLYALRMIVTRQNQEINTATIQVTVDNTPPSLAVAYPSAGQQFKYLADPRITFQAAVEDEVGIRRVQWLIDGVSIGESVEAPYAWSWTPTSGEHTLVVRAEDFAGNITESEAVPFEIVR